MFGMKEVGNYKKLMAMLLDILLVHGAYLLAFLLRYGYPFPEYNFSAYRAMIPYITLGTVFFFSIYGLMSVTRKSRLELVQAIGVAVVLLNVMTMAGTFFMRSFSFPRSVFAIAMVLQFAFLSGFYMLLLEIQRKRHETKCISIIGPVKEAEVVAGKILRKYHDWFSEMVICQEEGMAAMNEVVKNSNWVFLCPGLQSTHKHRIMQLCIQYRKELQLVPDFYEIMSVGSSITQMDDFPVMRIDTMHLDLESRILKRLVDILVSGLALLLLLPVFVVVAVCIKLTSPGPVMYHQVRITRDGREFPLYKFRSMVHQAEQKTGPVMATENDQRITRCGKWLRAWRLDELPQLINVLTGDMSLVGPRPERPVFVEKFEQKMPHYRYRKTVKAGITGVAQVRGSYSTSAEDKLRLDLLYIRNHSFWLDTIILMQTLPVLFNFEQSKGIRQMNTLLELAEIHGFNIVEEIPQLRLQKKQ